VSGYPNGRADWGIIKVLMGKLKYVASVLAISVSGSSLLAYRGLRTAAQDRARGWEIYPPSSHQMLLMVLYLALAAALPFLSAWLMRPNEADPIGGKAGTGVLWRSYSFRLGLSIICSFLAAVLIGFVTMAVLDLG
jgi:hypothetical protein